MNDTDLVLYHNPRCSKSRAALALLEAAGLQPRLRLYLEEPLSPAEVKELLQRLQLPVRELLRSGEEAFQRLGLADSTLSDEQLIAAICAEPKLLQRPIAVLGARAVIGRPPERVLELLA
jgi:arsenate reductase